MSTIAKIKINGIEYTLGIETDQVNTHNADANAHEALFNALKDRITALEGGVGTGTVYFYDSVVAEIRSFITDYDDPNPGYFIEIDGKTVSLDDAFFSNKCTHVNFGGTGDESGAYLFFYEKSVKLSFYEAFEVYVNGEDIAYSPGGTYYFTFTAPQVLHVTLHD